MNFNLSSEQKLIKQTAADFAADELLKGAVERDIYKIWPINQVSKMAELGFMGIFIIFILFFIFYFLSIKTAKNAPNIFSYLLSTGISFNILFYFLINSSYVVGLIPPTGIAIPFISYGGSHTLFTLISIGCLLNISKYSNIYKRRHLK